RTKKRKAGKKAAPARKKKRVAAKKSSAKKAKPKAKAAAAPKPAPAPSSTPSYTPPPAWPPMGGTSGGGSGGSGGGAAPEPPPRQKKRALTLAPVGSFSLREREPIASGVGGAHRRTVARAGSRRPRERHAAATQLRGDGEPNSIARARGIDALLLPHPPRGGGSLCRRRTTS